MGNEKFSLFWLVFKRERNGVTTVTVICIFCVCFTSAFFACLAVCAAHSCRFLVVKRSALEK